MRNPLGISEPMKCDVLRRAAEAGFFRNCCGRRDVQDSYLLALAAAVSDLLGGEEITAGDMRKGNSWRAAGRFGWLQDVVNAERLSYNQRVLLREDGMAAGRERLARERDAGRWPPR